VDDATAPNWDLETVLPGGPGGSTFAARCAAAADRLAGFDRRLDQLAPVATDPAGWAALFVDLEDLEAELTELGSAATCWASADARSSAARAAEGQTDELRRQTRALYARIDAALDQADDAAFAALTARSELAGAAPWLRHRRAGKALRLPPALQALKVALDREAITGWGRLYDQVSGDLTAELRGQRRGISEIAAMRAHPDPQMRADAYHAGQEAWSRASVVCAHALTHLTGARQQIHDRLEITELTESLHDNRVQASTVDAMWAAADAARPALVRYLGHKARKLGKVRLDWWDLDAPLPGALDQLGWDRAVDAIGRAFDAMFPELGAFAREDVGRGRWVDARAGEGRRGGGFCTGFPKARQSRIFMTFTGSLDNATTLAHEIGHAWHNRVLDGVPAYRSEVTSALAETASTFAEAVFRDRMLESATDPAFRAFMLDQQLQAAAAFLMDIPHRFAFERRLFALRRQGTFEPDQLSAEVVECQRRAWGGALASWNPTFWCSKLHFYIPEFGFYNWPYAFGYLFSGVVYARARAEGPSAVRWVKELLVRTGWQPTEELAREVLGVDLSDPAFWVEAVRPIERLVDAFLET
jgi:pepF/M3 family oligoendopeptidase